MKPSAWMRFAPALALLALLAPYPPPAAAQAPYTPAQLDQMLAPVALFPDPLLSQVLMAATYAPEVDEAARWARAHPELQGEDAVRAAEGEDWDPSVKSLLAFPDVLQRMAQDPQWTETLGEAFLAQGPEVMEEIQLLRSRAQAAGQLYSDSHLSVSDQGGMVVIAPANPQVVYVPHCNPGVVYGAWRWPSHPPVAWTPPPARAPGRSAAGKIAFVWSSGVRVTAGFFFGATDWHARRLNVVDVNTFYYRSATSHREGWPYARYTPGPWQHEPRRRHGYEDRGRGREHAPQPPSSPVSPARRMQLEQQEQSLQRQHGSEVSPARQMQLEQQQQYEQRQQSAQQPSRARQMQLMRPQ